MGGVESVCERCGGRMGELPRSRYSRCYGCGHEARTPAVEGHAGPRPGSTIERDFWRFHRANPHVYDELVGLARRWRLRVGQRLGIGMLFEVLRWRTAMRTRGDDFKLNNNYRSYYARLIMERESDLRGVFNVRSSYMLGETLTGERR